MTKREVLKNFHIYELDSNDTISDRIATSRKTLPEYIKVIKVIEDNYTDSKNKNISLIDLVSQISLFRPHELEKFYDTFKTDFPLLDVISFAKLWWIYSLNNGDKKIIDPFVQITLDEFLLSHNSSFSKLENSVGNLQQDIKTRQSELAKKVKAQTEDFKEFSLHEPLHSTPIEVVRVKSEIVFEVDYDIYELFNYMKMSRDIPFAVIGSYYKIMEGFVPSDKWSYAREKLEGDFGSERDVLYIKTLNVRNEPIKNLDKTDVNLYSTVSIFFETLGREISDFKSDEKEQERQEKDDKRKTRETKTRETKTRETKTRETSDDFTEFSTQNIPINNRNKVLMRLDTPIKPELDEHEIISRILKSFPSKIESYSKTQIQIKAEFIVPDFYLNRPLFLDEVMNNRLFYTRYFVDDRFRIQKEKGGVYLYYAFKPSDDDDDKLVSCSMIEQVVEKTNLKIIAKDPKLKIDSSYLRVRITKIKNIEDAEKFKNIFTRHLSLYQSRKEEIVQKYSPYISNFSNSLNELKSYIETRRKKSSRTKTMLKDIEPDQFISGYSRWLCPAKRAPRIVALKDPDNDEEPEEIRELQDDKNVQVILFPKGPEEDGIKYNQYYYACDHHKGNSNNPTIYPALRLNALGNSEKYPIVPCCYSKDHRSKDKNKSILRMYYEDGRSFSDFKKDVKDNEQDETHIFTTNKIAPPKRLGVLIKDVDSFFKSIDNTNTYVREGVSRSVNSVIESLLLAREGKNFESYTREEKIKETSKIRQELVERLKDGDIYQQTIFYSRNPESVQSYLSDNNKYLDPRMFTRLLEDYFKCSIFIFSQNEQYPFGVLSCPHNLKEYLQLKRKSYKTVFIYENMGSELDNLEYPQCELIVRLNERGEKKSSFENDFEIVKRTREIFNEMYISDKSDDDMIISFETPLDGQGIDFYGKTRFLSFADGVCLLTESIPPLHLPLRYKYKTIEKVKAQDFLKRERVTKIKRHIISGKLIGYHGNKGRVEFYIPIIQEDSLDENEIDIATPSFLGDKSELSRFNELHRTSRYLLEYTLYMFSLYYQAKKPKNIDSSFIIDFVDDNIRIQENFVYGKVSRLFSLESGVLRNKKLIVPNRIVLKKLVYNLRLRLRKDYNEVQNYSQYKYIQKYYQDIKDFDQIDNQLIIYGQHALIKWIENVKRLYPLYDSIIHKGVSLVSELSLYDTSKPFIIIFMAKWNKQSVDLVNRIVIPLKSRTGKFERKGLLTEYGHRFNFVYIDIDRNRDITSLYNVDSIPYIYFLDIKDGKSIELGKIKGGDDINENVKLIRRKIEEIMG